MKIIKKRILLSVLTTIILYLIIAFVQWDLLVILKLPNLEPNERFTFLSIYLMKIVIDYLIYITFIKK